jgi:hypothetical protein
LQGEVVVVWMHFLVVAQAVEVLVVTILLN